MISSTNFKPDLFDPYPTPITTPFGTSRPMWEWNCAIVVLQCPFFYFLFFLFFFIVRLFVGSAWSFGFSSPPQRPMTSDIEGSSIPDFIHYIYFPILILEKKTLVWRGPWLGIEPGTSRTRSQHYTTRLSRRRFTKIDSCLQLCDTPLLPLLIGDVLSKSNTYVWSCFVELKFQTFKCNWYCYTVCRI